MFTQELVKNGSNIKVTDKNLDFYIQQRLLCLVLNQIIFIDEMKKGLFSVLSKDMFKTFSDDQLELLINGSPFIDVDDWEANTEYKGYYSRSHQVIKWFWDIVKQLEQKHLERFLQFCTGTSRVPIGGFSALESNRGQIAKFCINYMPYNTMYLNKLNKQLQKQHSSVTFIENIKKLFKPDEKENEDSGGNKIEKHKSFTFAKTNNYIKAHTCFNRIDLPHYKEKAELEEAINFIIQNEILGFGID